MVADSPGNGKRRGYDADTLSALFDDGDCAVPIEKKLTGGWRRQVRPGALSRPATASGYGSRGTRICSQLTMSFEWGMPIVVLRGVHRAMA